MSQLDVASAKRALAARLKMWGTSDPIQQANGFIDDLVAQGWVMDPQRESRHIPPRREDQCLDCGRPLTVCARVNDCGEQRTQRHQPADATTAADQIRARLGWAREEGL